VLENRLSTSGTDGPLEGYSVGESLEYQRHRWTPGGVQCWRITFLDRHLQTDIFKTL